MRILVVSATRPEVAPIVSALANAVEHDRGVSGSPGSDRVDIVITGVGMVATAVWCVRAMSADWPDLALNFGVCGSFVPAFPLSAVVHVTSDMFPELGAQDGGRFLPLQDLGLLDPDEFPFFRRALDQRRSAAVRGLAALPTVSGITVNTVHGNERIDRRRMERFRPDVEIMEGAAFMYACLITSVPFAQVRAVSNMSNGGTGRRGIWPRRFEQLGATRAAHPRET